MTLFVLCIALVLLFPKVSLLDGIDSPIGHPQDSIFGVRCPTCAANGQEVSVIPGCACGYCGTGC